MESTVVHENISFFIRVFSRLTEENVKLLLTTNKRQKVVLLPKKNREKGRGVYDGNIADHSLISSHNSRTDEYDTYVFVQRARLI